MIVNSPLGSKFRRPAMMNGYGRGFADDLTSSQVGAGVGSGIASLVKGFLPGAAPAPYAPGSIGYPAPSWWDQQSLGTKVMYGGLGFLVLAGGVAFIRGRKKSA